MYFVTDPGETTGWAKFDDDGTFIEMGQVRGIVAFGSYFHNCLEESSRQTKGIEAVLYETYKIFPNINQGGSEVPAAQVIGIIKILCHLYHVPVEGIDPKYKRIGYAWSNTRPPSNHDISHGPDARALGEYWLRKHKVWEKA